SSRRSTPWTTRSPGRAARCWSPCSTSLSLRPRSRPSAASPCAASPERAGLERGYPPDAMAFPATRLRRLRKTGVLRDLVRETELDVRRLVYPMFVVLGLEDREPIATMSGIDRLSI